ncbi:MAG TPA: primary-amine oxidase [Acidimicrobiales bacterium]|nr:primary-amine oxidase [Acidimicrobiales bacterium]
MTELAGSVRTPAHPLEPVTGEEIRAAVAAVRATGRLDKRARFAAITLEPPTKEVLAAHRPGDPFRRLVRLVVVPGLDSSVIEALVDGASGEIVSWEPRPDVRPALLFDDSLRSIQALEKHPDWQAAMRRRGIFDFDKVQIDPWPTGNFGREMEEGRRVTRCLAYYRENPTDNGYARPIEGVVATVDGARGEVLEVLDFGVVPLPPEAGSYYPEDHQPQRTDLLPLEIIQPEGPSFTVESNLIRWQRWSLRVSMDPNDGLVLHTVGYLDGDRVRPVLHRASITEMVVPYGDPGPLHGWKNAFDAGEWGLGRMVNSLTLGCDCLGVISYLDATFATERGEPYVVENAVCIHEEDYGILWKHQDQRAGRTEVRRSRRLVVSSISTVGNYEYGFYWYFYLDGTIQFEVKLTGILSTRAMAPGERSPFAPLVAPDLAAPVHQHLFCARLDLEVDGRVNEAFEVSTEPLPGGDDNPWSNGFVPVARRLESEREAQRDVDPASGRFWKFANPAVRNRLGEPVAYKLVPSSTPTMLAHPDSSVGRRAGFARHNLWVTPFAPDERRGAGDYPNQHPGGDGLPRWAAQDRPLTGTDIVAWHTFGITHVPRPEDWPVMPVEYCGFHLVPVGFFEANPSLDVPPPDGACH